ncbi:TetR/AcrR family transcriptional regulator [Pseudonocardia sp. WMMC193]|uniref:TetR/AcrR family transcriptional regulator n=1 Tax=Pseudonocardia sp. WMMC193 TaxID=2911965 RepID=UPI001F1FC6A7|nr:TetR/AcrR family transcriptional regulator [Pseudonocardia sp. WMMC193]MCF7551398.1 TetR/AcrR family transcriptional regulator [Pseudonocardia sp. WMMC193]
MSERMARKRGERVRAILATAADLLGERGYAGVNLEDVAERLDVTKGSLYYYFASKDELVTAAIEALGAEWTDRLQALPAHGPPTERLRALLREHIRIAVREHPAALRLFLVPDDWPEPQRDRIKALRHRHDAVFRAVVEEGARTGEFAVVAVDPTLQVLHAGMSQAPLWVRTDREIEQLTETLLKLVAATA